MSNYDVNDLLFVIAKSRKYEISYKIQMSTQVSVDIFS